MGLLAMIPKYEREFCCMCSHLLSGSARLSMGLLAMIPKIVERVLLIVFSSIEWVCQIFHGSASHDPQVTRSGSARLSMGLLAMIIEIVKRVLLHVFSSIKWVCQIFHGSASHVPQVSRRSSAACITIH